METREKGAPIMGRGPLLGSGTEVEGHSSMHVKCQEMVVVGLMTGEVLIEGLETEGWRPGGFQKGEGRLLEDEILCASE